LLDVSTAGFANTPIVRHTVSGVSKLLGVSEMFGSAIVGLLSQFVNIVVPGVFTSVEGLVDDDREETGSPVQQSSDGPTYRIAAADILASEMGEVEAAFGRGNGLLEIAMQFGPKYAKAFKEYVSETLDVVEPFQFLRDLMADAVESLTARASAFLEVKALASRVEVHADNLIVIVNRSVEWLEAFEMPDLSGSSSVDLGDDPVSETIEWLIERVTWKGTPEMNLIQEPLQKAIDRIKAFIIPALMNLKSKIEWIIQFSALFQKKLNEETVKIRELGKVAATHLRKCDSIEALFNMLLDLGGRSIGVKGLSIDVLTELWEEIREQIREGWRMVADLPKSQG
jgi:hypothetical protein